MTSKYTDKTVLVTGGASGIGWELANYFATGGAKVIVADNNQSAVDNQTKAIKSSQLPISFYTVDLSDSGQAKDLFQKIVKQYSTIDYVINGAGVFTGGEMRDTPIEAWQKVLQNNILAVANGSHYAYQAMLKQGYGQIVNIGSTAGLAPIPIMGIYGASKYAISGLTHALRNECRDLNIKVNLVCPTIVDTQLYDTANYYRVDYKKALYRRQSFQSVEVAAKRILKGIEKNRATIHTSLTTQAMSILYRLSPRLYDIFARVITHRYRNRLRTK